MTMKSNRAVRPQHSPTPTMSAADVAAHEAASYVRQLPRRIPVRPSSAVSAAELHLTTEVAYLEREQQLATQVRYELAAGGLL